MSERVAPDARSDLAIAAIRIQLTEIERSQRRPFYYAALNELGEDTATRPEMNPRARGGYVGLAAPQSDLSGEPPRTGKIRQPKTPELVSNR